MGSPWKALSEDNRRQILLLLGKRDTTPTEIAKHLNSSLPLVSTQLRVLKDADLITEKKQGKNRLYSLNRGKTLELVQFFEEMYDYNLKSLKEYVENKKQKKQNRNIGRVKLV
jgi:ArsR family transcriptional regulator, arsenate/arsenite/antimonite-responsive transcriptional repressor